MSGPCGHGFSIAACAGCPLRDCAAALDAIADAVRGSDFEMTGRDAVAIVALLGVRSKPRRIGSDGRPHLSLVGTA